MRYSLNGKWRLTSPQNSVSVQADVPGNIELDLFRRSGMAPVFFGSALFGSMAPNVTYMLSFENDEKRREGWGNFVNSDEWKTKSKDPQYERTATRIRNLFLKPSKNSEI